MINRDFRGRFIKGHFSYEGIEKGQFQKGYIPWNKGKIDVYSKKTLNIMRHKKLGMKQTEETIKKRIPKISGENHYKWCGGISGTNAAFKSSDEYREWRFKVLLRDKYKCVICEKVGGELHAHHIKSFSEFPELRLIINNGITVCKKCHLYKIHKWNPKKKITIIVESI